MQVELPSKPMNSKDALRWLKGKDHHIILKQTGVKMHIYFTPFSKTRYKCECGYTTSTKPPVFCIHALGHKHANAMRIKTLAADSPRIM
jgi:hypothetical protein